MRKLLAMALAATVITLALPDTAAANQGEGRGGVMGLIAGCCFGIRAAGDYNEGQEIHWREWCRLIPYAGIVFGIWDGIEGFQGVTREEYRDKYGATFY